MDGTIEQSRWISNYKKDFITCTENWVLLLALLGLALLSLHILLFMCASNRIKCDYDDDQPILAFIKHIMNGRMLTDAHQFIAFA